LLSKDLRCDLTLALKRFDIWRKNDFRFALVILIIFFLKDLSLRFDMRFAHNCKKQQLTHDFGEYVFESPFLVLKQVVN